MAASSLSRLEGVESNLVQSGLLDGLVVDTLCRRVPTLTARC